MNLCSYCIHMGTRLNNLIPNNIMELHFGKRNVHVEIIHFVTSNWKLLS